MKPNQNLKIGTFSSEIDGKNMCLAKQKKSVTAIMDAIQRRRPDILLTAGYSLEVPEQLEELVDNLNRSGWPGLIFVEVKNYFYNENKPKKADSNLVQYKLENLSHCLWAWSKESGLKSLGRQYVVQSRFAKINESNQVDDFIDSLSSRTIMFRGLKFGLLICGEINVLQGRDEVRALRPAIESWLRSLDFVVNPTHDMMGNAGTLKAKRQWLSQDGRVYLSASNWNSQPKPRKNNTQTRQYRTARTLHTAYHNASELTMNRPENQSPDYEYREVSLSTKGARRLPTSSNQ